MLKNDNLLLRVIGYRFIYIKIFGKFFHIVLDYIITLKNFIILDYIIYKIKKLYK